VINFGGNKKSQKDKKNTLFRKVYRPFERGILLLLFLAASVAVFVSIAIIYTLADGTINFFSDPRVDILDFFTGDRWVPSGGDPKFGMLPLLAGTTLIAGGALLIGAPLGVGAALYLSEFAGGRARAIAKPVIEVLAGIPSIVYGFFALLVISPILRDVFDASYFNAASAIIVMSIMILPIVVSISDDAMRAVPQHLREASLAMGATKWETAIRVVMPSASSGIIASILLGLGRAIGETMVVTLAAGSIANMTFNPFEEMQTMTAYIAQVATGDIPPGVAVDAAFAIGLVLFIITLIVNMIAARVVKRIQRGGKSSIKKTRITDRIKNVVAQPFVFIKEKMLKIKRHPKELTLRRRYIKGHIGVSLMGLCLIVAALFLTYLIGSILIQGIGGINITFLTSFPSYKPEKAGILPVIQGSIYLMLLTMVIAVPIGVGAAIYLTEIASDTRSTRFLRRIIQNLAGVPSIVFGLVGLTIFVRVFGFGPSLLAGSLTLAIMVLPIIVVATEEALKSVPKSFREASRGLGATRWQTVRHHVLPNAKPGILTGTVLALSRAIGETAPILFIGAVFAKTAPSNVFDGFLALPLTIFYWTRHPKAEFHELAASTIIVLLIILLAMNSMAIVIRQRAQARRDW
jgi:phosphate ABC transporter permease protein PstC/phosphate ABC transporter permease subunit PstA